MLFRVRWEIVLETFSQRFVSYLVSIETWFVVLKWSKVILVVTDPAVNIRKHKSSSDRCLLTNRNTNINR